MHSDDTAPGGAMNDVDAEKHAAPEGPVKLGSALAKFGRELGGVDFDIERDSHACRASRFRVTKVGVSVRVLEALRTLRSALQPIALSTVGVVCLVFASLALTQEASGQEVPHHAFFDTDANTGGYAGVTLGESNLDVDAGELAHSNSVVTQGRPFSFELVGGYRPAPFWSGELAYLRLGQASAGKTYTQMEGYMLSSLVYLPTPYINLYGRLGALDWHAYGRCVCAAGVAIPSAFHRRGLSTAYGVGGTTNRSGNLNIRLEWDKLEIKDSRRADLVTLGLIWSFV